MMKVKTVKARDVEVGDVLAFHSSMSALSDVADIFVDNDGTSVTFISGEGARWIWELPAKAVVTILDLD